MTKLYKGRVYTDLHSKRLDRIFAVVWEGGKFVEVFSSSYRTSRISKKRLSSCYEFTGRTINTNKDFVPNLKRDFKP